MSAATTAGNAVAALAPLLDWVARREHPVALELACREHPDPARGVAGRDVVTLPVCAATVPEVVFYELLGRGARAVWVRTDGCAHADTTVALLSRCADVLTAIGAEAAIQPEPGAPQAPRRAVQDATDLGWSRRAWLRRRAGLGRSEGHGRKVMPEDAAHDDLPGHPARGPRRLAAALRTLAPTHPAGLPGGLPAPASDVAAPARALTSEGCTACGVCVRICPNDALALVDVDDGDGAGPAHTRTLLRHAPATCDGTAACIAACPEQALSSDAHWGVEVLLEDEVVELDEVTTMRCARCGARCPHADGGFCELCSFRRTHPFQGRLPAAVADRLDPGRAGKLR